MSKNIILIDRRIEDHDAIVYSIDPTLAVGIVFDYFEDTFETIKARIDALGTSANGGNTNTTAGISVGLVQHNYQSATFKMVASADLAPVVNIAAHDPDLALWSQFRDFIVWCNTEHGAAHFDLMACGLYSDNNWKYVIDTLTLQTGVTIRASTDDTGSAALAGNWFLESHTGVNLKDVYFTESIDGYQGILYLAAPYNIRDYSTKGFAIGSVVAWGNVDYGGAGAPSSVTDASSGVVAVYSADTAFAALKTDGSVVAWGRSDYGGSDPGITGGVVAIYSSQHAFAALKTDGSVVAWGYSGYSGSAPSSVTDANSGVVSVYSTIAAFAALKTDGSVVAWGDTYYGGTGAPSSVTAAGSGVVAVYSTNYAFAALKTDGSVQAWGADWGGGLAPSSVTAANSGVVAVYSTDSAFAALKTDGSVVAWGDSGSGGSAPSSVTAAGSGVVAVYSTNYAFAALKNDGSVVAWGYSTLGGVAPSSVTAANSSVVAVYSDQYAFAALKTDGRVVAWGLSDYGGSGSAPSSVTAADSGVVAVYSTESAFAALKTDGSVVAWGSSGNGGNAPSSVTDAGSGVVAIYSTYAAFAALKPDGSIVAWGYSDYGGSAPSSVTDANSGVVAVYYDDYAFAALKSTSNTFDLSASYYTDMDRYNILRKKENRRRVNLTTLNNDVFTLSQARDLQTLNPTIPTDKVFHIIVPTYTSSPLSITSSATLPYSGSVIIACDESEPVIISGTTYINYGSFVYQVDASGSYIKTTSATINGWLYYLYGGNDINSSGIALVDARQTSTLSASTFSVASSKTYGDASFAITTRPTSNSGGAITYSSSNTAVATIDASGNFISLVGSGNVTFIATQTATNVYESATITSNTLTVSLGTSNLSSSSTFTVASQKIVGDASFAIIERPTSNSGGEITYSSSDPAVATIDASGDFISLVGAVGDVSFIATQAETSQYASATKPSNTLAVRLPTTFSAATFAVESSKTYGDASFNITTAPTSDSDGAITYSSSNTAVATIDASGNYISLIAVGDVSFIATQAQTSQYASSTNTSNTLTVALATPTLSASTFSVASSKTYGDASFAITTRPTSNSAGAITYSSSNTAVATIDASGNYISLVGAGSVSFIATQAQTSQYTSATKTSNTLTVSLKTPTLSSTTFSVASVKIVGDASFSIITRPTSDSGGAITYSSSDPAVATIDASGNFISLIAVGDVSFIATQAETSQYASATKTSNTLAVRSTSTFSAATFAVESSKTYGDASFNITTAPTSNSDGAITYVSNNTAVATIDASGNYISLIGAGEVTFIATQAQTSQYASATNTSNTLTVSRAAAPTLAFVSPPTTKNMSEIFTVTATSASSGAVTYTSSNTSLATVGLSTGLVGLKSVGTVTITAAQTLSAQYNAPTNTTCSIVISEAGSALVGQTVPPGSSYAGVDFSGAILTGATLSGVSFSGASLINTDLSGVVITETNFTNTNISGAANLPVFSTVQKLQLLGNINNIAIDAIQITTQVSGSYIDAMLPVSVSDIASATFTLKVPNALDASSNRIVNITSADISNNASVYIPLNTTDTVNINGAVFSFNGTIILDDGNNARSFLLVEGFPFKMIKQDTGSIIVLNITVSFNEIKFMDDGLYDIFSELFELRST
jgi:alpha-tubulin suppressor-like RCC1 family protein